MLLKVVSIKLIRALGHLVLHNSPQHDYKRIVKELTFMIEEFKVLNSRELHLYASIIFGH